MTLLSGRRLLVTGVLTESSIAYSVARLAAEHGAEVVLSSFGRPMSLTRRVARRLPGKPEVIELDVTSEADLAALPERVGGRLDGVLHAIGFAPASALGSGLLDTPWEDVATALHVSTWSYAGLARACAPLMPPGSAYVGLDFDATVAWPSYGLTLTSWLASEVRKYRSPWSSVAAEIQTLPSPCAGSCQVV